MFFTQYLFPGGGITPPGGMKLRNPWGGGQFLRTSHMYIYFDVIFAHVLYEKFVPGGGGKFCVNPSVNSDNSIYNVT